MPGPLSRLRERVGVRVFACRQGFVSHEAKRTQKLAEKFRQFLLCQPLRSLRLTGNKTLAALEHPHLQCAHQLASRDANCK